MNKTLMILTATAILGGCAENKKLEPISGGTSSIFTPAPAKLACPAKMNGSRSDKAGIEDAMARAGIAEAVAEMLIEEFTFDAYYRGWADGSNRPSLKPFNYSEADRVVEGSKKLAAAEVELLMKKLEETKIGWTDLFKLLKDVHELKYENGNHVSRGSIKETILRAMVWCHESTLN